MERPQKTAVQKTAVQKTAVQKTAAQKTAAQKTAAQQNAPTPWHARSVSDTIEALESDVDSGLSSGEVEPRQKKHGPNLLRKVEAKSALSILIAQCKSIVVYLLAGAMALAFVTGRSAEGIAVFAVIVANALIGFVSEWRANRSMAALREMGKHACTVIRQGKEAEIDATELVPGDLVIVREGDLVPADIRLIETEGLRSNEAALTGESVAVDKVTDETDASASLADQQGMLFKGTNIVAGEARGLVVATGQNTELGKIAELAGQAGSSETPLQERLDSMGRVLAWITVGIAIAVAAIGYLVREQEAALVIETALALGIAAIPEGLPIVSTIALARGMYRLAQRNALVNRLTAVETLGATTVIFTDKTGTLTENRMRLVALQTADASLDFEEEKSEVEVDGTSRRALEIAALCNAASLDEEASEDNPKGDPTELALLARAQACGIERDELIEKQPQSGEQAFDPKVKMMATFHDADGGTRVAVKGAPDAVFEVVTSVATDGGDERTLGYGVRSRSAWRSWPCQFYSNHYRTS